MSHLKERSEKKCLNCNAVVHGRFCHVCGQENLEPEESAWHLFTHFINDITHFDGKFFSTLKYILFKPGFLSAEYKAGRRASYLNPVRLYVFTSFIFFLIFFSVTHIPTLSGKDKKFNDKTVAEIEKLDDTEFAALTKELNHGKPMTRQEFKIYSDTVKLGKVRFAGGNYKSIAEYDSLIKTGKVKDGYVARLFAHRNIELQEKYKGDGNQIIAAYINQLVHSFPQMLFISLPLFALVLKLLYLRRKDYYYVSHTIFTIHYYVFTFIVMLAVLFLSQINHHLNWTFISILEVLLSLLIFFYLYKAMRNFYRQGRGKTILKFLLLNLSMLFVIILLFLVFTLFSMFKI